ncbi:hypothetical protein FHS55_002619 [Angulomicrobium tetraedrale]|uniref:Uncharacterized protein n=1 Tax=Ancylobacter tetraedralis TaxID=217068 RepID=A0A839ZB55_9HYPH|nr:hypothetical protein [Ancylobacter tetraedralis]MBB3772010.1 hypothetical protein [Ancylobacter tetraedralis]
MNDTMAFGYMVLIAVLILGYSGFATAQDVAAIWATRSGLPYAPTAYPPTAVGVPGMSPPQPARSDPTPPPGYAS